MSESKFPLRSLFCLRLRFAAAAFALAVSVGRADEAAAISSQPLAARSGPRGATMFRAMTPEETGIVTENAYNDPKMWAERANEFALGSIGTGVAIGDYDNDGRPDLFVVSKTGGFWLYHNLGNWKFEDVTERAGLVQAASMWDRGLDWMKRSIGSADQAPPDEHWKGGVTFVDVNNDGWLDIYVCRYRAPNLLFINQHDGTFKEEAAARGLALNDSCCMAEFCDYDRDGWLDVFVHTSMLDASAHPNGQRNYLLHNNGDGTFTDVTAHAGIAGDTLTHSVVWWDFDNDGWPDLYVANDFAPADQLYHNNHDGTFTNVINRVVPHMPYSAMGSDLGDVNNDGLIDLFVADMAATTHEKDQRAMAISREMDARDAAPGIAPQYQRNVLYLNTGTGRVLEAAILAGVDATDWTWSPRLEDLDNDGRLDLQITNGMVREFHNADLRMRIVYTSSLAESRRIIFNSPVLNERHVAFRNLGDLKFQDVSAAWGLDQRGVSFGAAYGDLDGDGDLDLVYANYQHGVTVLRNDCQTGHRLVVALRGTRSNRFGVGATVRIETATGPQVRQLVLARGYMSNSEPILHFGLGDDTRIDRLTVAWPSGGAQTFTNLDVDQRYTITEPATATPAVSPATPPPPQFAEVSGTDGLSVNAAETAVGDDERQPLCPVRFGRRGPAAAVGDLEGDGREDIVMSRTSAAPAHILRNRGASRFSAENLTATGGVPVADGPALVFDADGDGSNDLLVTRAGTNLPADSPAYQPLLLLNDGHGALRPAPADALPPLPISAGAVAAADFDRDGRLDVFIGARVRPGEYPLPGRSALLANRGGRFEDVTDTLAPGLREVGLVTAALWSDVDGDGWPDLLVACEWGGIRYFHNDVGKGFSDQSVQAGFAAAGTGWWTALAAADFNGDGRPDYVAGNVGLNTPYREATPERPDLLFYGKFADTAQSQLVEAYYEGGKLYPRRPATVLGTAIPSIRRRYARNDAYARATLPEILGEARLAAAQRFAATEFRSGVFLSQPDGTYRFEPLPRLAQIAPWQGVVAGDFDGDGHADIYAVQNSYAPIPSIGHFDGGLSQLLRGDGHGHFTPVPLAESGLVVPGDAKALAVLDLDGDGRPDFFVTRNNDTTLAFRNAGHAGRHAFRVVLRGPPGNPSCVGARVTVELSDGTVEAAEVAAGSGYYSQSSSACFFGYADGNPPRRLRVRWPSGAETTPAIKAWPATITVTAP